jgi:hypothetical protein
MDTLNKDCLCSIVYHLNFSDIYNFSKTCRKIMKQVYNNKYFWIYKIGNIYEDELFLYSLETLRKNYYYSQYSRHHAFSKAVLNGDVDFVSQFYDGHNVGLTRMGLYNASSLGHLNVVKYLSTDILPEEKSLVKMCMDAAIREKHSDIVNFYMQKFRIPKEFSFWKTLYFVQFLALLIILVFRFL